MVKIIKFGIKIKNDNVNSFQYVTHTLMELFSWDLTQAANCAHIVDRRGDYVVKWFDHKETAYRIAKILEYKGLDVEVVINRNETLEGQ